MSDTPPIYIERLTVKDHPVLGDLSISFEEDLTVIVGKNGAGKTSLLRVLSLVQNGLVNLPKSVFSSLNFVHEFDLPGYPTSFRFHAWVRVHGQSSKWDCTYALRHQVWALKVSFETIVERGSSPLLVFYPQDRAAPKVAMNASEKTNEISGEGLNLLEEASLEVWWNEKSADEGETVRDTGDIKYRDPELEAVRNLISNFEEFEQIKYRRRPSPGGLFVKLSGGGEVPLSDMSSGERAYILLMADLARRLQLSQPRGAAKDNETCEEKRDLAGGSVFEKMPGVILIDELELKMHPEWQNRLVSDLPKYFPSCQFIVTTHSPMVVSGARGSQIRALRKVDGGRKIERFSEAKGRSADFLLQSVFETYERDRVTFGLIDRFHEALEEGELQVAETVLDEVRKEIEGNPPALVRLKKRLERAREDVVR
jgi:predicted ATP-binding protein involved in virulence